MCNTTRSTASTTIAILGSLGITCVLHADPLPGEVIKFQQLPINNLTIPDVVPTPPVYQGHDNVSVAYQYINSQGLISYQGGFMADDFADKVSTPVVHLKWWGSYPNNNYTGANGVQQFLVAWESDVPAQPGTFSHPGSVIQSEIVNKGALLPQSGTFTETLLNPASPEHLYQYNAELKAPFAEQKDTVYWLKIVALTADTQLSWGWHNRDYTQQDIYASPAVVPGESVVGFVGPAAIPTPVWHFQDDAVRGAVDIQPILGTPFFQVTQPVAAMGPTNYVDNLDGPPSSPNSVGAISNFSQDLAFELYTVPEPSALGALAIIGSTLLLRRRRASIT